MNDIKWIKEKKVFVWGCGYNGRIAIRLFDDLEIPITLVDSNPNYETILVAHTKHKVYKPDIILSSDKENIFIFVVMYNADDVIKTLNEWGFEPQRHYMHLGYQFYSADGWDILTGASYAKHYTKKYLDNPPDFSIVEIETISCCNNDCGFCPVNRKTDPRPYSYMDEELFDNIIGQLSDINFSGCINLFSNNEPFLDPDIVLRIQKASSALPNAKLHLFSNGSLLSLDKFLEVQPHLDRFIINSYADGHTLTKPIQIIDDYIKEHPESGKNVEIVRRVKDEVLTTRGGKSPNGRKYDAPVVGCLLPFSQISVRANGHTYICCNDAQQDCCTGDAKNSSLMDIWRGSRLREIRNTIIEQGRPAISVCRHCDVYFSFHLWK